MPTYKIISKTFSGNIPQSTVHEDNEACLTFPNIPNMPPRSKHVIISYHFFRAKVQELEIKTTVINTEYYLTDQFTEGIAKENYINVRKSSMGW